MDNNFFSNEQIYGPWVLTAQSKHKNNQVWQIILQLNCDFIGLKSGYLLLKQKNSFFGKSTWLIASALQIAAL